MQGKEVETKEFNKEDFIKWFSELSNKDISIAGGKGASLAEMYNHGFPIPPGFIITASAYRYFLDKTGLVKVIKEKTENLDMEDTEALNKASEDIRKAMEAQQFPNDLKEEILDAYGILDVDKKTLGQAHGGALDILRTGHEPPFVAVRSSATAEDLADASFAGQQESFLNVKGEKDILLKVRKCFSSLFTARAIYYRTKKGFSHTDTALTVVVQKMVDSKKSGVIFSKSPVGNEESIMIEAVFGLGEGIVSGRIKPDNYMVDRNVDNLKILSEEVSEKKVAIVRDSSGANKIIKLTHEKSRERVLTNYEIKTLAQHAMHLEEHYKKPQDIEFAIDDSGVYIVQSRPITTLGKSKEGVGEISGNILLAGLGASPGIASGVVKIIHDLSELKKVKKGDILVTEMTNPDMVVSMQKSTGIITDEGGITSHAAIISREMGIPCVVGTDRATQVLHDGQVVTVDGYHGKVIEGKAETKLVEVLPIKLGTRTKIKVIADLPEGAERASKSKAGAVGLTRLEGIIAISGKHPFYYVKHKKIDEYVEVLFKGLKGILKYFNEIWVRSSDIRSDEYRNLEGASKEVEGNPMLGDHGIRFSLKHKDILKAEFQAIRKLAEAYPDKTIGLMAPQIISVSEVQQMKQVAREAGISEDMKNVKIGIMVETPAAVQIINDLCEEGIDFISFGTNDLTQFTLAIDRNNEEVQNIYDEMNPAVLNSLSYVIRRCKKYGVETSICGQAGSRPEMAAFLVKEGIDSISVNADAAKKVSEVVYEIEQKIQNAEGESESEEDNVQPLAINNANEQIDNDNYDNKRLDNKKHMQEKQIAVHAMASKEEDSKDIEEEILEQLGDDDEGEDDAENGGDESYEEENGDYNPGLLDSLEKADIPPLHDAFPVNTELIDEISNEENDRGDVKEDVEEEESAEEPIDEMLDVTDHEDPLEPDQDAAEEVLKEVNELEEDKTLDIF